jgi:HlyD family secretion protein
MRKVIIPFVAIILLGGIALYGYRNWGAEPDSRILLHGNIEMTEVDIAFKTAGRLIERTVNEGDSVEKGRIVARLDPEQLLRQREQALAGLALAKAQLVQAETATRHQRESVAADLDGRKAELNSAQARLRELQSGSRPEEVQEGRAVVSAMEAEFERARGDWERAQVLFKNDDISRAQFDQARARYESANATLRERRERLKLVEAGPRAEVIEAQASQVERARAGIRLAEANTIETQRREQEIAARRADIERAQAQVAVIDSQIQDMIATTPVSGVVLSKSADVGEVLAPGTTVVTIGDMSKPWLRAYINETNLGRVKIGAAVNIRTDSYPDKTYQGRVTFIASEAEFTPKQIQTADERVKLAYRVKIEVDNPNGELKSNMPADAEIAGESAR